MARKKASNEVPAGSVELPGGDDLDFGLATETVEVVADDDKPARGRRRAKTGPDHFMDEAAESDRTVAKAKHVDDGLRDVAEMVSRMTKGIAYAKTVHDLQVKLTVLAEVADTASAVVDDARRAVRNAQAEKRNLQPS